MGKMILSSFAFRFLIYILTADAKRFSCDQTVTPCACVPDDAGVYYDAKDCAYECCPTYNCDPYERKCKSDLAGGYPWAHCLGSCNEGVTGYECDPATMQCQPSTSVTTTKEYCETECGSQGESSVVLCAYYCGSGASQFALQNCIGNPQGVGKTPICPGQPFDDAHFQRNQTNSPPLSSLSDSLHTTARADCCATKQFCPQHRTGMQCCDPDAVWDAGHNMCQSSAPAPPPSEPPVCPDGSKAKFLNNYPMSGGLRQCMQFDCSWDAQLCGPADCPEPTIKGPACASPRGHSTAPSNFGSDEPISQKQAGARRSARPRHYMGIEQTEPAKQGRSLMHSFHWQGDHGNYFRLKYHALLTPKPIFSLEEEAAVQSIQCHAGGVIVLHLEPVAAAATTFAKLNDAHFLTGAHHWGCTFPSVTKNGHLVRAIVRRVLKVIHESPSTIRVSSSSAKYDELFEHANLSFSTNYLPQVAHLHSDSPHAANRDAFRKHKEAEQHVAQGGHRGANRGRRLFWGCLGNFFSKAWNGIKQIAQDVGRIVNGVVKVIEALLTGDYSYDHQWNLASINWNYDASSGSAARKSIPLNDQTECTECYVNLEVSVNVDLEINSYQLRHAASFLEGDADVLIHALAHVQAGDDLSFDVLISTLKLPDVHFMVGPVPFVIQTTVPIHAGGELSATDTLSSSGDMETRAQLMGQIKYGVQYTSEAGFQFINQHTLSHHGGLAGTHLELTAVAKVHIMPVIVINVDHIGGPHVGFKGFAQTSIDFKSDHSLCSATGGAGTSFTSAWGLQLTLGAQLDIEFAGHTFLKKSTDDEPIWSHQWPLAAGCLDLKANNILKDANGFVSLPVAQELTDDVYDFFEGVQYVGDIIIKDAPECDKQVSIHGGLQFVNQSENGYPGFVGVSANNNGHHSSLHDYNVACVGQHYYIADGGLLKHYIQPSLEPDVAYTNCSLNMLGKVGATLADLQGKWQFSSDLSTIFLAPSNPCITPVTLRREKKTIYSRATMVDKCSCCPADVTWNGSPPLVAATPDVPRLSVLEANALLTNGTRPSRIKMKHE